MPRTRLQTDIFLSPFSQGIRLGQYAQGPFPGLVIFLGQFENFLGGRVNVGRKNG